MINATENNLLSFEEFVAKNINNIPRFNNFPFNLIWMTRKSMFSLDPEVCEPYLRFKNNHPKLFEIIQKQLKKSYETGESPVRSVDPIKSYEAYKIMRCYEIPNQQLFG